MPMRNLNQLRIDAGYSIAEIARLMQVDEATACDWLCGRVEPTPEQQRQLAFLLRVQPEELDGPVRHAGRLRRRMTAMGTRFHQQRL